MHNLTKIKLTVATRKGDYYRFSNPESVLEPGHEPVPFPPSSPDDHVVQGSLFGNTYDHVHSVIDDS